jgi:O-antigen ligase
MTVPVARALLWLFVLSVPLDVWPVPGIGGIAVGVGIPLTIVGVVAIARRGTLRRLTRSHHLMLAFVLWSTASILWTVDAEATQQRVITNLELLFFAWMYWQLIDRERDPDSMMFAYVIGCTIAATATVTNFLRGETTFIYETRYVATGFDPNDLGVTLALGIPLAWSGVTGQRGWRQLLCLSYIPLGLFAILLTASRGALITTSAALLIVPFAAGQLGFRKRIIMAAATIGLAGYTAIAVVPEGAWARLMTVAEHVQTGSLNGRVEAWRAGFDALSRSILTGVGAGAYGASVETMLHERIPGHNAFVSVLVELGPVGFAIFVGILLVAIRPALKARPALVVVLCLTWMIGVSSLTWEYRKTTWLFFSFIAEIGALEQARRASNRGYGRVRERSVSVKQTSVNARPVVE